MDIYLEQTSPIERLQADHGSMLSSLPSHSHPHPSLSLSLFQRRFCAGSGCYTRMRDSWHCQLAGLDGGYHFGLGVFRLIGVTIYKWASWTRKDFWERRLTILVKWCNNETIDAEEHCGYKMQEISSTLNESLITHPPSIRYYWPPDRPIGQRVGSLGQKVEIGG